MKIKRILVATDFSEPSQEAILRAVELAELNHSQLIIIHIAYEGFLKNKLKEVVPVLGKIIITPKEYATPLLQKQINKLAKRNLKIHYEIMSGSPGPKIVKYAKNNQIDLLVMGAHGKYSIHDWFVGTTAEYVSKKAQCPVLIVKKPVRKPYQKILVPIDFSKTSKEALKFAMRLFPKVDFRLLHVGDHQYDELLENDKNELSSANEKNLHKAINYVLNEKVNKFIKDSDHKLAKLPCDIKLGYPGIVIINEAKKHKQDLVIMGTQGHSQRHYLFIGRVAMRVLIEIDRDILLVPPKNKKS